MSLLQVIGSPLAPSGKTLTSATRLSILYSYAYADDSAIYPIRYDASYDTANNRWKPLGSPNGTLFYVPGPVGNERFPTVTVHEFHVYSDGTSQNFYRENAIIEETSPGTWNYAYVEVPEVIVNSISVAWIRMQVPLGA